VAGPVAEAAAEPAAEPTAEPVAEPVAGSAAGSAPSAAARPDTDRSEPTGTPATAAPTPGDAKLSDAKPGDPKPEAGKPAEAQPGTGTDGHIDPGKPVAGAAASARVTRVLRHANPVRAAKTAGRTTHAWAKRPAGRLIVPTVLAALLLGAAGTAGAYLVPQALEAAPSPSATPGFPLDAAAPGPTGAAAPPSALPQNSAPAVPALTGARPADALADWAQGVGTRVGIPVVAVQAYGYAELVVARTAPSCHLSWTTIAAIGKVESAHGSANGAVLGADGSVQPPVLGLPLDGKGGRQLIRDTDQGALDKDPTFDRAMGPMQFIPATWREMQIDADNSGFADPNDIDDAALAAAMYLCKGGRDMSRADAWWEAILSYNAVQPYAQKVFDAANEYGRRSRV
jgi:hypothetical protein